MGKGLYLGSLHRLFLSQLDLFLVLVNQMDEGLNQILINLAKTMMAKPNKYNRTVARDIRLTACKLYKT